MGVGLRMGERKGWETWSRVKSGRKGLGKWRETGGRVKGDGR